MKYTNKELRGIAQDYPFLFESLFLEKNHHVLRSVVTNLESVSRIGRIEKIGVRMNSGEIGFRCADKHCAQRRSAPQNGRPKADAATELLRTQALERYESLADLDHVSADERKRMQLRAIAARTL